MNTTPQSATPDKYAQCIEVSRRIRWDIDRDVIQGREFGFSMKFLPDALTMVEELPSLNSTERRILSQVQGRTYANMFGLVERFIGAKMLEVSRDHWLGDQTAFAALVRFTEDELKHQELFRRVEQMIALDMPEGYAFLPQPNDVANFVLGKSTWSVLALTCFIELFSQAHYRTSIEPQFNLSPLWKDVFLYHWKEESQHAILDELEWIRENGKLSHAERDRAVDDLIDLVIGVDGIVQMQAKADARYFRRLCARSFTVADTEAIDHVFLKAYRFQYIVSGMRNQRFLDDLARKVTASQLERIARALAHVLA